MNNDRIELHGNAGVYITDGNVLSLQIGEGEQLFANPGLFIPRAGELQQYEHQWLSVNGFQICMRGMNNALCDEVTMEIKQNRLLPRLYNKEINAVWTWALCVYADNQGW